MIPKHVIDEIMNSARIEEVIGDFVALKKSGSDLKALSPFANEKTPSFFVSPNKQIFKDFSSGKGGNVVTFLMEHEQMSYPEALRFLAKRYNIEVPEEQELTSEEILEANEKESLLIVLAFAEEYFKKLLHEDEEGKTIGKSYFRERGFREDTVEKFALGYAKEGWNNLYDEALKAGHKEEFLIKAGLVKKNESGKVFDMFRGRVIFPIQNLIGKTVAFAARQLNKDDKGPKYINSPESPVYHKSDILYGLFQAKNSIRVSDKCYLVEGYTDVITLNQHGIENVVASSGTSLTEGQIRQIKRFTPNVTVLYDGDPAGLKASQRGIDLILQQGLNVRLVIFPNGEDPDSYCKQVGGELFGQYIKDNEQDFILFKSKLLLDETGKDPLKKAEAVRSIVESIALIPDPLKRSVFATECAGIMEVPEQLILTELNKIRRKNLDKDSRQALEAADIAEEINKVDEPVSIKPADTREQEKAIVKSLVRFGHLPYDEEMTVVQYVFSELEEGMEFQDPLFSKILLEIKQALENEIVVDEAFFTQHPDMEINSFAADALVIRYTISADWEAKHEISILTDIENYQKDVFSSLLHYKIRKVDLYIIENQEALKELLSKEPELPEEPKEPQEPEVATEIEYPESAEKFAEAKKLWEEEVKRILEERDNQIDFLMQKHNHLKQLSKELTNLTGTVVIK